MSSRHFHSVPFWKIPGVPRRGLIPEGTFVTYLTTRYRDIPGWDKPGLPVPEMTVPKARGLYNRGIIAHISQIQGVSNAPGKSDLVIQGTKGNAVAIAEPDIPSVPAPVIEAQVAPHVASHHIPANTPLRPPTSSSPQNPSQHSRGRR